MKHEPVSPLQVQPNGEQLQVINDHLEKVWFLTLDSLLICLLTAVCMAEASCYLFVAGRDHFHCGQDLLAEGYQVWPGLNLQILDSYDFEK